MTTTYPESPAGTFNEVAELMSDDVYVLPASVAQQRFWILDQIEPGNTSLNMPLAFKLSGTLNLSALQRTFNEIISRHEILRTTFTSEDDRLMQVIAPEMLLPLELTDISQLAEAEREEKALQLRVEEAHTTFNLNNGPLLKTKLIRLASTEHILLLTMHHIICDGWSNGVLVRELGEIYGAFSQGFASPLADLPIQYADFALWQQEWLESESFEEQLAYWKQQLGNELPLLNLPTDFPRNRKRSSFGAIESLLLSRSLTRALKTLSQREDVTPFMIFLAAYKVLLHRYSGQQQVLVGSPTANRIQSETEGLIGSFANTLMLKTDFSGEPSFRETLQRVKEMSLGAFSNQSLPFEKLIEEIKPAQARSSSQLFQALFIFQTAFMQPVHLQDLSISPMRSVSPGSIFELSLGVVERAEGVRLQMEYNTDLFEAETIKRMLGHLQSILQAVVTDIRQKVSEIALLTQSERELLLVERNRTEEDFPAQQSLCRLFDAQANLSPEKPAVVSGDERLSYAEVKRRSDELALHIQSLGAQAGEPVGISAASLSEFVIAALGALKAGCTMVPLNAELRGAEGCGLVIGRKPFAENTSGARLLDIDEVAAGSAGHRLPEVAPQSLAARVFDEAGKGSAITHRALIARCTAIIKEAQLTGGDTVLLSDGFASCSTLEMIFAALLAGAGLSAVAVNGSAQALLSSAGIGRASVAALPAPVFHRLSGKPELLPSLRLMITGGGRVSPSAISRWLKQQRANGRLLIAYGTPETGCAAAMIEPAVEVAEEHSGLRISRPAANAQIYVLDANLQALPAGVPGEVFIAGELLAAAPLDEAAAPLIACTGKKVLGTQDVARYLKNGEIELLGGAETPAVELSAAIVEDALLTHDAVLEAKAVFKEDRLAAYVALKEGETVEESELRALLAEQAARVTMAVSFIMIPSLPLTAQGQIDERALPDSDWLNPLPVEQETAADNQIENELKEIWKELLNINSVGLKDDFFELGGHSLAAAKLFEQIKKRLGVNLPLVTMFKATTIEQLARIIREEKPKEEWSSLVAINANGSKPPLFVVHAAGGNVFFYKDLAARLGANQPVYGLQPKGLDGNQKVHARIEDMAAHYLKEIKQLQPQGPYCFGGTSFGGLVAYEMAVQLRQSGETAALVALFDTYAPGYPRLLPGRSKLRIRFSKFVDRIEHHIESLRLLDAHERWSYVVAKAKKAQHQFRRAARNARRSVTRGVLTTFRQPLPEVLKKTQDMIIVASRSYRPQPYKDVVTLFRADKQPSGTYPDPTLGWSEFVTGKLEIHEVPGSHGTIVVEPRVRFLVKELEQCIDQAISSAAKIAAGN